MKYQVRTFGKWILAGEHTVLRGGTALAFPIQTRFFELQFLPNPSSYQIITQPGSTVPLDVFERTLLRGLELIQKNADEIRGQFTLDSNIPLSSGLGGSASLCVAIANLFHWLNWLDKDQMLSFCRKLEDMYHGQSSGLDVATVLANQGISFRRDFGASDLAMSWKPNWHLLHSGVQSRTKDDVAKVNALFENSPKLANEIDAQMKESVRLATKALTQGELGLPLLVEAQKLAGSCFVSWDIIPKPMQETIDELYSLGALAVKPTGSGGGGFILSLWPQGVEPKTPFDLLSVYA